MKLSLSKRFFGFIIFYEGVGPRLNKTQIDCKFFKLLFFVASNCPRFHRIVRLVFVV